MVKLLLYSKKQSKITTKQFVEIDLSDLEQFGNFNIKPEFYQFAGRIIDGKSILDWFSDGNFSYWWLFVPILLGKYYEATVFIDRLKEAIKHYNAEEIVLHELYEKKELIEQICSKEKIKLNYSYLKFLKYKIKEKAEKFIKKNAYKKITNDKLKKRLDCINEKKYQIPKKDFVIVTSHQNYLRDSFDLKSRTLKKEEYVIQPILDLCNDENIPLLCFDLDYTFKGRIDVLQHRLKSPFNWAPIEILLQKKKKSSTLEKISQLKKSISKLLEMDLSSIFMYDEISLWNYLKPKFHEFLLEPHLPTYLHLINVLEEFLSENRPKKIIQLYEVGPFAKSFEIAAKKLGIKTIGIQHGNMINDQPDYMHREIHSDNNPLGNPIPDQTFVFGNFHHELLTKNGHYPNDKVIVIGNPSFYNIDEILVTIKRDEILKKYEIPDKKIILVPLSYKLGYENFRNRDLILLNTLYKTFKNDSSNIILVRPHPGDIDTRKILDKLYPKNNFVYSKLSLFEDLVVSNLVILTISSVALDTIFFNKPLIIMKITDKNDSEVFKKIRGILLENKLAKVVEPSAASKIIMKILNSEIKTYDKEKRTYFLKKFFNYGQKTNLKKLIYN